MMCTTYESKNQSLHPLYFPGFISFLFFLMFKGYNTMISIFMYPKNIALKIADSKISHT